MEKEERSFTNTNAQNLYNQTVVKKQNSPKKDFSPGTGRLNLFSLFYGDNENTDLSRLTFDLFKKLIVTLYREQPFYVELIKERPNFVEEIVREITVNKDPDTAIKDIKELSNIHLKNDAELDFALYEIIKGFPLRLNPVSLNSPNTHFSEVDSSEDTDTEDEVINETYETHAEAGTKSLLDYVTIKKNVKTRIYIASRALLQVIYEDQTTVEQIIDARNVIYKRLKSNPTEKRGTFGEI